MPRSGPVAARRPSAVREQLSEKFPLVTNLLISLLFCQRSGWLCPAPGSELGRDEVIAVAAEDAMPLEALSDSSRQWPAGRFDEFSPYPPIADYAFLSDCEVTALVAPSG